MERHVPTTIFSAYNCCNATCPSAADLEKRLADMVEQISVKDAQLEEISEQLAAAAAANDQITSDNEAKATEILGLSSQLAGREAEVVRLEGQGCQLEGAVELEVTARTQGEVACQRLSEEVSKLNHQLTTATQGRGAGVRRACEV